MHRFVNRFDALLSTHFHIIYPQYYDAASKK